MNASAAPASTDSPVVASAVSTAPRIGPTHAVQPKAKVRPYRYVPAMVAAGRSASRTPVKPLPSSSITPKPAMISPPICDTMSRCGKISALSAEKLAPSTTIVVASPRKKAIDIATTRWRCAPNVNEK